MRRVSTVVEKVLSGAAPDAVKVSVNRVSSCSTGFRSAIHSGPRQKRVACRQKGQNRRRLLIALFAFQPQVRIQHRELLLPTLKATSRHPRGSTPAGPGNGWFFHATTS